MLGISQKSSPIEFFSMGLKQQLVKMHNSSVNTSHSARFSFDEHLAFSEQISTY